MSPYRPYGFPGSEYTYPCLVVLGLLGLLGLNSCASFEDAHTGTYVEVREGLEEELTVIDLFRAGDYAHAVVRTYRVPQSSTPSELFDDELDCVWTALGAAPSDEEAFTLSVPPDDTQGRAGSSLTLSFPSEGYMELVTRSEGAESEPRRTFKLRGDRSPDHVCEERRPFFLIPDFDLGRAGLPPSSGHTIKRPVFAMLWLGVQARRVDDSLVVWAAKNVLSSSFYLSDKEINRDTNGLRGELRLSVSPPEQRALSRSGETSYALGHFVVIDDSCAQEDCSDPPPDRLSWDVETEPIIAVSLERGVEFGPDEPTPRAVGLGRALFYVEGRLSQLNPGTQRIIEHIETHIAQRDNAHFYMVDVYFDDNRNIVKMRLPPDPQTLSNLSSYTVPVVVTPDYLRATEILLPRLLPIGDL